MLIKVDGLRIHAAHISHLAHVSVADIDHLSVTRPLGFAMIGRNVVFGVRMPVSFNLR